MRKQLYLLFTLVLTMLPLDLLAGDVTPSQAMQIARDFMQGKTFSFDQKMMDDDASAHCFYIFNAKEDGFVIVSADDRTSKLVLGYSDEGHLDYDQAPDHVKAFLDSYTEEIKALDNIPASELETSVTPIVPPTVAPLLGDINWDQGDPYYNDCPKVGSERCVTGCVATAMAQVMYYWKWPAKGKGSITYTWETYDKKLSCNFASSTYNWKAMTPTYTDKSSSAAKKAVALLMRDCGYSVQMDYDLGKNGGSGAYTSYVAGALKTNFDYDASTTYVSKSSYSSTAWDNLIRSELTAKRPVVYHGRGTGGHAFVCDGCNSSGYFHFNFGWSGACNGYYSTSAINPYNGYYNFSSYQGMIMGIRPNTAAPPVEVKTLKLNKSSQTIKDNENFQLTATITPTNATNKNVTWTSSNPSVAYVTSSGWVYGQNVGTATITCQSVGTPSKKATCKVTVKTSKIAVTSVKLNKSSQTIKDNENFELIATVNPTDAYDKSVTWTSSNTDVAQVFGGKVYGMNPGTATITCQSVFTPTKKATCKVTVKTSKIAVTSVKLNKSSQSLKVGETFQLTPTVGPTDAYDKSVTWKSSNEAVATVSASGLVTAVSKGSATITCQSVFTPTKKATCRITVQKVATRGDIETDDETITSGTEANQQTFDVYNVQGRKVLSNVNSLDGLPKGVYIVNGKKIVKQ